MKKIRIMHVIWSATIGGIEKLVLDLTKEQKLNEILDVSVLIARPEGGFLQHFTTSGIEVHTLNMRSGGDVSISCYRKARSLFKNCDIIHMHSFNPLIAVAARNSGKKIIYTEHGNFGFGRPDSLRRQLLTSMQKRFLNDYVNFITFNSEFTRQTAVKRYGMSKPRKQVVYNGISLPYQPAEIEDKVLLNEIKNKFVVGTVARLAPVKKLDRLINAFALFAGTKDVKLLIIGDGPLMHDLKRQATESGIEDKTIFAGYRDDARNYFQLMNAVVIPSANEAFGIAAIEALDQGKPVIVFGDGGGLSEIIAQIEPSDVVIDEVMLASRLNFYFSNPMDDSFSKRKNYAANFSISRMQEEFVNIYLAG